MEVLQVLTKRSFFDLAEFLGAQGVNVITDRGHDGVNVEIRGCEGSDRNTCEWARLRGFDVSGVRNLLDTLGLPCDCSILLELDLNAIDLRD
jgi:hypothetical protein